MRNKQYLTFDLYDLQYGIESVLVQEIFPLPELKPIAKNSGEVIGIFDWHGQVVPVIHLGFLQRYSVQKCHLSDFVILVQWEGLQIGLVVHQVNELLELNAEVVGIEVFSKLPSSIKTILINGVARVNSDIILLLNSRALIHQEALLSLIGNRQMHTDINQVKSEVFYPSFYDLHCSNATLQERAIFRQRADSLRQVTDISETTKDIPIMVIRLGNEYFGMNIELVREITSVRNWMTIPYSPKHIIGNMLLRGEIITLVDIRNILHLPITSLNVGCMAVVIQVNNIIAGVVVDEVLELSYINSAEIKPLPITASITHRYIQGRANFQEKILSLLNLERIFTESELVMRKLA